MEFKIESDKPAPSLGTHGNTKYPFGRMAPGESFLLNQSHNPIAVRSSAVSYGLRVTPNRKFIVRKTDEGYRCWRVS